MSELTAICPSDRPARTLWATSRTSSKLRHSSKAMLPLPELSGIRATTQEPCVVLETMVGITVIVGNGTVAYSHRVFGQFIRRFRNVALLQRKPEKSSLSRDSSNSRQTASATHCEQEQIRHAEHLPVRDRFIMHTLGASLSGKWRACMAFPTGSDFMKQNGMELDRLAMQFHRLLLGRLLRRFFKS